MKALCTVLLVLALGNEHSLEANLVAATNVTDDKETGSGLESGHGEDDHAFEYIISTTKNGVMDKIAVESLLQYFNETCLTSDDVFSNLNVSVTSNLTEEQFTKVAPYIVLHLIQGLPCNASAKLPMFDSNTLCRSHITTIIDVTVKNGKFTLKSNTEKCFGAITLLDEDCTSSESEINLAMMKMIAAMRRGDCILPEPAYFMAELREYLQVSKNKIDIEPFVKFLTKLKIGVKSPLEVEDDHDHEDEEETTNDIVAVGNRNKRSADDNGRGENVRCYSTTDLLNIFEVDKTNFSLKSFVSMCPAFIQQIISGSCEKADAVVAKTATNDPNYTIAMKYGYGTAAVLVISLLAFGGLLLFPQIGSNGYKMTMQFFIALGVGTLSGDALLHLIPEVVGLHKHEAGADAEHAHEEEGEEENEKLYIWRILVVIGGIYLFYLFENVLRLWNVLRGSNITFHVHDDGSEHNQSPSHTHHHDSGTNHGQNHLTSALTIPNNNCKYDDEHDDEEKKHEVLSPRASQPLQEKQTDKQTVCCGVTPVGIMVLIGDVLHNFGDGIALGVAFSSSWVGGLGASIAIFCHELPHEFGDFAIYMKNGMSKWKALGFNFMAACFAFIGLFIGLSIAENPEAREWMLAVIAGMFLYISLVDVLHEMIEERTSFPILQFVIQNVGMCLGWAILLLLALYEDQIKTALE